MELAWQTTWGGTGKLNEPRDVAVIGDQVFIADTGNRQVQVWNKHGEFITTWDGGEEPFEEPLALSVDDRGRLLVLDSMPGWIYRTEGPGEPMQRIGGPNSQMFHPRGMTSLPDGSLVVADTGGGRLVFFDSAGTIVGQMGRPGNAPGQLSEPTDVAVDEANTFYVAEAFSQRMQHLDGWGGSMAEWPIPASIAYDGPHLAWAPDGSLLATAPGDSSILRYAPDGRLLNRWTSAGPTPMIQPVGIYVDDDHTLYVTDTATHTIYVFEIKSQSPATSSR
jgi:DNA-binding beta-propeller fold protein YncE